MNRWMRWGLGLLLGLSVACGEGTGEESPTATPTATPTPAPPVNLDGPFPYETLSEYAFFKSPMSSLLPKAGVIEYEPVSPLWTDGAYKSRFIVLPEGETLNFVAEGAYDWPVGSVLIKNFYFPIDARDPDGPLHIIETRLLIHETEEDWTRHTYVWNAEQDEAFKTTSGKLLSLDLIDGNGNTFQQLYQVPNTNQCGNCHEVNDVFHPLGPVTEQLNMETESGNQLHALEAAGVFTNVPPSTADLPQLVDPMVEGDLDWQARSYLHANCAHCHQVGGDAHKSGLYLSAYETDPQTIGICKEPVAAGGGSGDNHYDIVPGSSESSILPYRMASTDPDAKMPEIGTLVIDEAGVDLIRRWIDAMEPVDCDQWGTNSQ